MKAFCWTEPGRQGLHVFFSGGEAVLIGEVRRVGVWRR